MQPTQGVDETDAAEIHPLTGLILLAVSATGGGSDLLLDFGAGDQVTLVGVTSLEQDDFVLTG